jgi:hypothetical protein
MSLGRTTAVTLLLSALLVGCGGDEVDDPTVVPPSPAGASAESATAAPAEPSPTPAAVAGQLTGNGIDLPDRLIEFGARFDDVQPALVAAFGEPTEDTGVTSPFSTYGTCPGSQLRALEFAGGALYVLFGDVDGPELTMYQWTLTDEGRTGEVPKATALVGDMTTYAFGVGETLASLREGSSGAELEVFPENGAFPASFRLQDQSPGFYGYLTGTDDTDTLTGVQAGTRCGE